MHLDAGKHFAPELGQIVVDDGDWREAGVDHLEHVIVLEDGGGFDEHGRRLAARLQLLVQLDEALFIDAPLADEHLLAGEIVRRGDRWRAWPGDHNFAHIGTRRLREGRELLQLGSDGHHGRDHVHLAAREGRVQLIARHRHDHHVDLEVAGLQVRVQIVLELLQGLVRQPPFLPLVNEVVRAVERYGGANRATLDQGIEVAGKRLVHRETHGFRKGVEGRRRFRNWNVGRRLCRYRRHRRRRRHGILPIGACGGGNYDEQAEHSAINAGWPA